MTNAAGFDGSALTAVITVSARLCDRSIPGCRGGKTGCYDRLPSGRVVIATASLEETP